MKWHREDRCASCGQSLFDYVTKGGSLVFLRFCPNCGQPWAKLENDWTLAKWPEEDRAYLRLLGACLWRAATKE